MEIKLLPIAFFVLVNLVIVLLGYMLVKRKNLALSWFLLFISISFVHIVFLNEHPAIRMLAIIVTTFTGMKAIAVIAGYNEKNIMLNFSQWLAFAVGWAGMRAQPFEALGTKSLPNAWPMIRFGTSRIITGGLLIFLARKIALLPLDHHILYVLVSAMLLVGFSLILHFGLLSVSAGMWQLSGVNTYQLFRQPAKATSLTEFWSKRWNLAFSEMTSVAIFRPLKSRIGSGAALMVAFVFSGMLHELALSVPVISGYGLPMLYFVIQGVLVLIEKGLRSYKLEFLDKKLIARLWVFFWLVIPMPLLFHERFIKEILWRLAGL
jgi:hypothetical protein